MWNNFPIVYAQSFLGQGKYRKDFCRWHIQWCIKWLPIGDGRLCGWPAKCRPIYWTQFPLYIWTQALGIYITCTSACTILLVLGPWLGVHRSVCVAVIRKWGDFSKSLWKVYKVGLGPVSELKQGGLMKLAPSFMQTLVQKHGNRAGLFRSMDIEIQEVINT